MTGCQYQQPVLALFVSMQRLADGTVEKRHTQNGPNVSLNLDNHTTDVGCFCWNVCKTEPSLGKGPTFVV